MGSEMATVSKKIADDVIAGKYPEDGVVKIVLYNNQFNGGEAYGLVTEGDMTMGNGMKYEDSPACHNCRVYWEKPK